MRLFALPFASSFSFSLLALVGASAIVASAACGDDDTAAPTDTTADAAPEAALPVVVGDGEVKQSGKIVRARATELSVEGATVTVGTKSVPVAADGTYEIAVPKDQAVQMMVAAPEYFTLLEQEYKLTKDVSRGETQLLPNGLANLLAGLLPGRDATKGILVVRVNAQAPCTDEEGAMLALEPQGDAKLVYFAGGLPDDTRTGAKAGEAFSAAFYNVTPNVALKVTVTSPKCTQVPFPVTINDVTFTGNQRALPGDTIAYLRTYIGAPLLSSDAGTD